VACPDSYPVGGIPPVNRRWDLRKQIRANCSGRVQVIDQYRVAKDDNDDSIHEPDRMYDEQYIGRLIGLVITVRLKTVKVGRDRRNCS
jgi:hypothetical protein